MKKIPSLFRKKYTAKKLEKKIFKKLYVPEDKKYVKGLFEEIEKKGSKKIPIYAVPEEKQKQLAKKDMKRLKLIAKQIKKQKGRVNFIPLIVTVCFIAAIPVCFTLFKNIIIKKGIQTVSENVFEARCDIEKVDFKFFDASLRIKKIEIANKNDVMKNLVDVGSIAIDFDLNQLLKKRFVADELSVLDVNSGTERKYSGELPPKKLKKIEKSKEKTAKKSEESKVGKLLKEKKESAASTLEENISGLFNQLNPEALMNSYYEKLQTPGLSGEIQEQIPQLVAKYEKKPAEIEKMVSDLQGSVNDIVSFDLNSIQNNPVKIKEFIEKLDSTYKNIDKVRNDAITALNDFNTDMNNADALRKKVQSAVTHDMDFANSEINKIKSLNISDGTKLISGMFENVACEVLGKYYPYAQKGVNYLLELKAKQGGDSKNEKSAEPKKEKKKYSVKRAPGRDVYYRQDKVPALWIKKLSGSGPNFIVSGSDIASNQDLIDKPAKLDFQMNLMGLQHAGKVVVDFRTETKEPLILAEYGLKDIPLNIPAEKFGSYPGVPSFDAKCVISTVIKIFEDEGFEISGKGIISNLKISTVPFEPEYASKIYANVMARIDSVVATVDSGFTVSEGLKLNIKSDADLKVLNSLRKEMDAQLAGIKNNLKAELTKKINEASGGAVSQFSSLDDIKKQLTGSVNSASSFEKQLEKKRAEAEQQLKNQAAESVKNELGNQLKKLF